MEAQRDELDARHRRPAASSSPGAEQTLGAARPAPRRRIAATASGRPHGRLHPAAPRHASSSCTTCCAVSETPIPGYAELDRDTTAAVLEEAGKIARDVLAPLNAVGDREGCRAGERRRAHARRASRRPSTRVREGGWTGLDCDPDYGGQGMPYVIHTAVGEMHVVGQHGLQHVLGPDPRRLLRDPRPRHRRRRRRPSCRSSSPASGPAR